MAKQPPNPQQPTQQAPRPKSPSSTQTPSDLNNIYLDIKNPVSYSSNVREFLRQKTSISVHKRRIENFKRRQIIVPGPFHSVSADLIDYSKYSYKNGGYKYILCIIDMFSRFSYVRPVRTKTAQEVSKAIESIFETMQFLPRFFTSDKG